MAAMKRVQIRLSEETLARLDWLTKHLDLGDRSTAIRLAVAELYNRLQRAWLRKEKDGWVLVDGAGQVVARCSQVVVDRLPGEIRTRLQTEGMNLGAAVGALLVMLPVLEREGLDEHIVLIDV